TSCTSSTIAPSPTRPSAKAASSSPSKPPVRSRSRPSSSASRMPATPSKTRAPDRAGCSKRSRCEAATDRPTEAYAAYAAGRCGSRQRSRWALFSSLLERGDDRSARTLGEGGGGARGLQCGIGLEDGVVADPDVPATGEAPAGRPGRVPAGNRDGKHGHLERRRQRERAGLDAPAPAGMGPPPLGKDHDDVAGLEQPHGLPSR